MSEVKAAPERPKENIMGTSPINPLLIRLAVPMMISMLVQALYNVVDSIFVSRVAEDALSALSLAFPIQSLLISFAVGTGVGVNALVSKSLGEKNSQQADRIAINGLFLSVCSYLFFMAFGFVGVKAFFAAQTDNPVIYRYGVDYLTIVLVFSIGCFLQCMLEKLLTSTGRSFYAMITQMSGAITNIILDPIMIFGLFGFPRMEAAGAAVATVVGQFVGCSLALYFNLKVNKELHFRFKGFRPDGHTIKRIYSISLPTIVMQSIGSVMTLAMNTILMGFSSTAVAVFGAYFKLQSFIIMPVLGLNNGLVPIVGFNYGARRPDRIMKTIQLSWMYAIAIMCCGFALFQLAPNLLLNMFDASPEMTALGVRALRTISFHFPVAGYCIITGSVFQAMGKGMYSLGVSVGRQLVVLIPVAYLLSLTGDVNMVWWSFLIAEAMSMALSTFFLLRIYRNIIKPMYSEMKQ